MDTPTSPAIDADGSVAHGGCMDDNHGACQSHCCARHGCKYRYACCPVITGQVIQDYPCEFCAEELVTQKIEPAIAFEVPEGYALGYTVTREAWYYRHGRSPRDTNVLMVGLYGLGGGCRWEFAIDEDHAGGPCLRVKVFDDAWPAFADIPEFFAALAADAGRGAGVEEVVEILARLGFRDFTKRENPHPTPTA